MSREGGRTPTTVPVLENGTTVRRLNEPEDVALEFLGRAKAEMKDLEEAATVVRIRNPNHPLLREAERKLEELREVKKLSLDIINEARQEYELMQRREREAEERQLRHEAIGYTIVGGLLVGLFCFLVFLFMT